MPGLDANTKLLLHGNGNDGAKEIIDSGITGHVVTQVADAKLSTAQKKFGSTSCLLDGTGDYLTIPDSSDWDFGTGNFTIDFWIRLTSLGASSQFLFYHFQDADNYFFARINATSHELYIQGRIGATTIAVYQSVTAPTWNVGTWQHIAIVRNGTTIQAFVDGTENTLNEVTSIGSNSITGINGTVYIGYDPPQTGNYINGHIDEYRISKGVARWTTGFTPETSEYVSDANTVLLLHCNTQDVSGDGGSGLYHIPKFNGDAQIDTAESKFGGGSYLFDGAGDCLTIPDSSDWDIFAETDSDWTVDCWVKFASDPSSGPTQFFCSQHQDTNNRWHFRHTISGLNLFYRTGGTTHFQISGGIISDTNWHHVSMIKVGNDIGLYLDGNQVAYQGSFSNVNTFTSDLFLATTDGTNDPLAGRLDEIRIQNSNPFNASPVVGLSDTITVPTSEYSLLIPSRNSQSIVII